MFWTSIAAAGLCLGLVSFVVLRPASRRVSDDGAEPVSPAVRLAWPWVLAMAPACERLLSWRQRHLLQNALAAAGLSSRWQPSRFLALQVLAAMLLMVGAATGAWVVFEAGVIDAVVMALVPALVGFLWPRLALRSRARKRRDTLRRELPFLLDMITLCVQAGMNLHGALQQAASLGPAGPLRDELRGVMGELRAGRPRMQALQALAERSGLDEIQSLVVALAQAEHTGMSLAPLLLSQSAQRRSERFLRAEKLALEAPVKMLFPMVLCIFPCTFMVIAFPVVIRLLVEQL